MVCVLAAMKREVDPLLDAMERLARRREGGCTVYEGSLGSRKVRVCTTGIGSAKRGDPPLGDCSYVVSTGYCGALTPGAAAGDIVVSTALAFGDAEPKAHAAAVPDAECGAQMHGNDPWRGETRGYALPPGAVEALEEAGRETGARVHFGPTFTSPGAVKTPQAKRKLHELSGALAVDMEDRARYELAREREVPFLSVRVVLDELGSRIPSFESPLHIPADMASLVRKAGPCARSLAGFLARFVEKFELR